MTTQHNYQEPISFEAKPDGDSFKANHWAWAKRQVEDNLHVFVKFYELAARWRSRRGAEAHMGSHMLLETIRYETGVAMKDSEYKISNNLGPLYARLFLHLHPDAQFDTKRSKYWDDNKFKWYELIALFEEKWYEHTMRHYRR
jgi:hypothetical protein